MSEEMIIKHCSPTLAGIKTGSMFSYPYKSADEMRAAVRRWNRVLTEKGLRVLPLRYNGRTALIYIYRPAKLSRDLQNTAATQILKKCGYGSCNPDCCVARLVKRMSNYDEFPHEIGFFLGYPPEDVSGFIKNKAHGCKCVGYWKVYGDEESARRTFGKYNKCTRVYREQYARGKSLERLTVKSPVQ